MVSHTSSSTYWKPLRPRISIYELEDSAYVSPLYTYNAFTDVGSETKPIAVSFTSGLTNVGTFSLEIEDSGSTLDPDVFTRGNRVVIECSKDGVTWQSAFKGLVRSADQKLFATTGRNLVLNGYSYLIRLNERVVNTIKESAFDGLDYDRTDSTMFTNTLVNNLLTTDNHYINLVDDTQLNGIFKVNNIASSPIVEWIPRLDAQLVPLGSALARILEFSNGVVMFDPADDELMLYTSDLVTPSTGTFLITNQRNEDADDADYTMYPLEQYQYNISYDSIDHGSRLIGSIGNAGVCPPNTTAALPATLVGNFGQIFHLWSLTADLDRLVAPAVQFPATPVRNLAIAILTAGNNSAGSTVKMRIWHNLADDGYGVVGPQLGSSFTLHNNGQVGNAFATTTTDTVIMSMLPEDTGPDVVVGKWYYLGASAEHTQSDANWLAWKTDAPQNSSAHMGRKAFSTDDGAIFQLPSTFNYLPGDVDPGNPDDTFHKFKYDFFGGALLECGGQQATTGRDPVFTIANDRNMAKRMGVVERVLTNIPSHIKTAQTLNEYIFNRLYYNAKPRFFFDFPSLSMCNTLPQAGDLVTHVDTRTNVGLRNSPLQTGFINTIRYGFDQGTGTNDALGLRKLALTTTGIKRGSY